jgi:hypothetical protein
MIICCPHVSVSFDPTMRAKVSVPPPGTNGTMNLTGLVGNDCASAAEAMIAIAAAAIILKPMFMDILLLCEAAAVHADGSCRATAAVRRPNTHISKRTL